MIMSAGSELGPWTVDHVDPDKMKVFAEVLADPNPIHLDPQAVIDAGLGDRVINQGPASFGYVLNMLHDAAPLFFRPAPWIGVGGIESVHHRSISSCIESRRS